MIPFKDKSSANKIPFKAFTSKRKEINFGGFSEKRTREPLQEKYEDGLQQTFLLY